MSLSAPELASLLPAILRIRDVAQGQFSLGVLNADDRHAYAEFVALIDAGTPLTDAQQAAYQQLQQQAMAGPLVSLVAVLAEQIAALQENVEQLYDDQFIETCADWVVPYIGDLIGYDMLHGVAPKIASPRAEVAHTIAYRRRKGTAALLEQLARDVTGWNATAVEFFQRIIVTQYMNHRRPFCTAAPDLRRWEPLERMGSAFDSVMHTIEVRRIRSQRGRYNIPNVGIFLWSINAYPLHGSPAVAVDARRLRFHPLGIDQPLYTNPCQRADFAGLSTPLDVPVPISRRVLDAYKGDYYTAAQDTPLSMALYQVSGGARSLVGADQVCICNLQDHAGSWAHLPTVNGMYAIDPVLGRIATPPDLPAGTRIEVDFMYGFSADMGGGEYDRSADTTDAQPPPHLVYVPSDHPTLQAAIDTLGADGGVVVISDDGRYEETLSITVPARKSIVVRADNHRRPTVVLQAASTLAGGADSRIELNGLLLAGTALQVPAIAGNALAELAIRHCTLVPGLALAPDATPLHPDDPSLLVAIGDMAVTIERSILGGVRMHAQSTLSATDSIIDATSMEGVAYANEDTTVSGGALTLSQCTVIGRVRAQTLALVSNSILLADQASLPAAEQWPAAILAERLQEGCIRFSYLPPSVRVPRRYQCLPESADTVDDGTPHFTTLRYGFPAYAQLAPSSGTRLLMGADNECQPGAFNFVYAQQRETNLRVRLAEYLRIGLEAGVFYES